MAARDDDEDSGDATKNDVLLPCHDPWHRRFRSTKRTGSTVLGMLMLSKTEPEWRDYQHLVRVLIRCAHCGMPLWAQTFTNGRSYYREHRGSRGIGGCADIERSNNSRSAPQCGFASSFPGNQLTVDEQWRKLELVRNVADQVWS